MVIIYHKQNLLELDHLIVSSSFLEAFVFQQAS